MLFPRRFWPGLADGTVTVAFRRWRRRLSPRGQVALAHLRGARP